MHTHAYIHANIHAHTCIVFTRAKSIMHIHAYNHTCATLFGPDFMQTARRERIVGRVDAYLELQACVQGIQTRQTGKADRQGRHAGMQTGMQSSSCTAWRNAQSPTRQRRMQRVADLMDGARIMARHRPFQKSGCTRYSTSSSSSSCARPKSHKSQRRMACMMRLRR